jgi:4-amino-4-deoxychorismate lyase
MSVWINGRRGRMIDHRDRGLQYGDGIFETMRVRRRRVRLLEFHLQRLYRSCGVLKITPPNPQILRREIEHIAGQRSEGVLKLILTRGRGTRGYAPTGRERCTRIATLQALPASLRGSAALAPVRVRVCSTVLGSSPALAGLKTLNRLESVLARAEWSDARIWEGLLRDTEGNWVCGTMSNLFLIRGTVLMTPMLDRCGIAGVMRRWILQTARELSLRVLERRIQWPELRAADEIFLSNALVGLKSVRRLEYRRTRLDFDSFNVADRLRTMLELQ